MSLDTCQSDSCNAMLAAIQVATIGVHRRLENGPLVPVGIVVYRNATGACVPRFADDTEWLRSRAALDEAQATLIKTEMRWAANSILGRHRVFDSFHAGLTRLLRETYLRIRGAPHQRPFVGALADAADDVFSSLVMREDIA